MVSDALIHSALSAPKRPFIEASNACEPRYQTSTGRVHPSWRSTLVQSHALVFNVPPAQITIPFPLKLPGQNSGNEPINFSQAYRAFETVSGEESIGFTEVSRTAFRPAAASALVK